MRLTEIKALKYARSGRQLYRVWGHPMGNIHQNAHLNLYTDVQVFKGKQQFNKSGEVNYCRLSGAAGNVWFTKKAEADKYLKEILDGHHPAVDSYLREYSHEMDLMDEAFGIDRGLGTMDEEDYLYDQEEMH